MSAARATMSARLARLAPLWLAEFALAQLAGRLVASRALAPFERHPLGGEALFAESARPAADLALRHGKDLIAGLLRAPLPAALWAVCAVLLALYPFVALTIPAPTLRATLARALRRSPQAALLEGVALIAHAACFACGLLLARVVGPYASSFADSRLVVLAAPLAYLAAAGPLHVIFAVIADRARAELAASPDPPGALSALRSAAAHVTPVSSLVRLAPLRVLFAVASLALSLIELRVLLALGPAPWPLLLALAAAAHTGRTLSRTLWIARLTKDLRAASAAHFAGNLADEPRA